MRISLPKKIRKYLIIYIVLLLALFVLIELVPKATDIFENTEILEPGTLQVTCEATGYFVKDEAISVAPASGSISYLQKEGTILPKNQKVVKLVETETDQNVSRRYSDLMDLLKGYDGLYEGTSTPISGILSLKMDGCEKALSPDNLDAITRDTVNGLSMKSRDLGQEQAAAG